MWDLLLSLQDSMSTSSSGEETIVNAPFRYSTPEIIFWYSAFAVALIVFIVYMTSRKTNKKKLDSIISKVSKSINIIESLSKAVLSNADSMKRTKKDCHKVNLFISSFDVTFIELKEKTRLDDFDRIISGCEKIEKKLRRIKDDDAEKLIKDLAVIQEDLIALKGQIELVKSYLH